MFLKVTTIDQYQFVINTDCIEYYKAHEILGSFRDLTLVVMRNGLRLIIPTPIWKFEQDTKIKPEIQFWT